MKDLLRLLKKFLKLSIYEKKDYIKAYILTGFFRAYILFVPFKKLSTRMGVYNKESCDLVDKKTRLEAKRISRIVRSVSKHTFWESLCLVQALTVQRMLKSENIYSTIYLGVSKDENNNIISHAWTRCGQDYITGGSNKDKFTIVAKFSNKL